MWHLKRIRNALFFLFLRATLMTGLSCALQAQAQVDTRIAPIAIVTAESVYGDVLKQLGGDHVQVSCILDKSVPDPHLFEATTETARQIAHARLVVYNGAGYDVWMEKLLAAGNPAQRRQIVVAHLVGKSVGDNPHLWYLPETMPALAHAVHTFLVQADAKNRPEYDARLLRFLRSLDPVKIKIAALRARYRDWPVAATESAFEYLVQALGFNMLHTRFAQAVMNGTEPAIADVAALTGDLRNRTIKLLIYNRQTSNKITQLAASIARQSGIPCIMLTETLPATVSYSAWMLLQLNELDKALAHSQRPPS